MAIFIYWGWDTSVSVNEETEDATQTPGRAAVASTFVLLAIYVIVSFAAQAFHGIDFLSNNSDDVLERSRRGRARLALGQAADHRRAHVRGGVDADDHPADDARDALDGEPRRPARRRSRRSTRATSPRASRRSGWVPSRSSSSSSSTPCRATSWPTRSTATGFGIAFYYGLTGLACPWFFRHELFKSARNLILVGLLPLLGGIILLAILGDSGYEAWSPASSETGSAWLGISPPLAMALLGLAIGIVILVAQRIVAPEPFFRWKTEVADPAVLEASHD